MFCRKTISLMYVDWLKVVDDEDCYEAWTEYYCLWLGLNSTLELSGLSALQCEQDYTNGVCYRDDYRLYYTVL